MSSTLPLIVGFGGYSAAGRSSNHHAYNRCIIDSLSADERARTLRSISALRAAKADDATDESLISGTLVRRISRELFDVDQASCSTVLTSIDATEMELPAKALPDTLPKGWLVRELAHGMVKLTVPADTALLAETPQAMSVRSAGQLPEGFLPAEYYRSNHHPRGLQLAVLGASDCLHHLGVSWSTISELVKPDQISVYASSVMSQMDASGNGGLLRNRLAGHRASSKQLAMGLNSMPADFLNAYVLGSVGTTGAVTGACASFLYNLKQGAEDIRSGRSEVAFVGTSEAPILPEIIDGYAAMSALATDDDLRKLDNQDQVDHRRASRPFGLNAGFTLGESAQFIVLMSPRLAELTGATIYGSVPGVYVHADGFKKSISSPGAGNYLTMARATALAANLLGDHVVKTGSFIQAHGSSTPQNRVTESAIFDKVAAAFGINQWPVAAVKSYLGHSLASASGDQLVNSLGIFAGGILPGIKTISQLAPDVVSKRLLISPTDQGLEFEERQVALLNSKGFGGNNATACVFGPDVSRDYLQRDIGSQRFNDYRKRNEAVLASSAAYDDKALTGELDVIYNFGKDLINEDEIVVDRNKVAIPGFNDVSLLATEDYTNF